MAAQREVMRRDDPFGIPACFYWTVDEVADWIDSIGYGKYKENFRSHFINGRKLLTVDSCVLPKMGITHFGDILAISRLLRDQLHVQRRVRDAWSPRRPRGAYIAEPQPAGTLRKSLTYMQHLQSVSPRLDNRLVGLKKRNLHYSGWEMEPDWDKELREKLVEEGKDMPATLQERLRAAALLAVDKDTPKPEKRDTNEIVAAFKRLNSCGTADVSIMPRKLVQPTLKEAEEELALRRQRRAKTSAGPAGFKSKRSQTKYLKTVFSWKPMGETLGYPQLMIHNENQC